MVYRYFDGRPPSLAPILSRNDAYPCALWREADLAAVFDAPAQLSMTERLTLFSLVLGQRPARAVEVGSFRGGSAQIIVAAMDLNGFGELVMIDPTPDLAPGLMERVGHRATLVAEPSPEAFAGVEGGFDFAFIDAVHTRENVRADLLAVTERMAPGGMALLHDVLHPDVRLGVEDVLQAGGWIDGGVLCTNATYGENGASNAGLGMLRRIAA